MSIRGSILRLLCLSLVLAGCERVTGSVSSLCPEVRFSAIVPEEPTKAYREAVVGDLADGFRVAGCALGSASPFMNDVASLQEGVYRTGRTYYYPTGRDSEFCAVWPVLDICYGQAGPGIDYMLDPTEDVVAAYAVSAPADSPVALVFRHLLSQVSICVKGKEEGLTFSVHSIALESASSGHWSYRDSRWTLSEATAVRTYFSSPEGMPCAVSGWTSFGVDNLALFPAERGVSITVEYRVWSGDTLVADYTGANTRGAVRADLEIGRRCEVDITLPFQATGEICFDVTVSDWDDPVTHDVIID